MRKPMILIAALALVLSSAAAAGEVQVDSVCPVKVVTLSPTRGLSEIIELVPQVVEVRAFALDLRTDAVEASVTVDTAPSASVLATVVKALGKALLKALATLIHHVV